jgi:hypothetical protein
MAAALYICPITTGLSGSPLMKSTRTSVPTRGMGGGITDAVLIGEGNALPALAIVA